jgi:hypothetical protein
MFQPLKVFSYGGGVQSTAALVLAAQGKIDYQTFLFCNVGADSENPETLSYVREIARPFAERSGLAFHELQRVRRDGSIETIYGEITRPDNRSIGIPVYMSSGAPGNRSCTLDFKIAVCDRWLKAHGVKTQLHQEAQVRKTWRWLSSVPKDHYDEHGTPDPVWSFPRPLAVVGLGISLDEFQRMRTNSGLEWKQLDYPLIDLRLDRSQCMNMIAGAGLPVPPKSSCWFCPYHSTRAWQDLRTRRPDLFEKAVELETLINERRALLGKDRVWLSSKLKPLMRVTTDHVQLSLLEHEEMCESGYCFV